MYRFINEPSKHDTARATIEYKIEATQIDEVVEAFRRFLLAVSFADITIKRGLANVSAEIEGDIGD